VRAQHIAMNPELPKSPLFPWNSVVGVIDDPESLERAVQALTAAGFDESSIHVLAGATGEHRIDAGGKRHGIMGRIFRKVHSLGDEGEHTKRHVDELQLGHFIVIVPSTDDRAPEVAGDIIHAHGGHFIYYYTRMTSRELAP
jgi:hypothetical protein